MLHPYLPTIYPSFMSFTISWCSYWPVNLQFALHFPRHPHNSLPTKFKGLLLA